MPEVVGIRFKPCGKIYSFETNGIKLKTGMRVVIESAMGLSLGLVMKAKYNIESPEQQLKKVIRIATVEDLETDKNNVSLEEEAHTFCIDKVKRLKLSMKVVGTEATLDRKRLIFYFSADERIDFRELVRNLASRFKTRIEMRQIGVRDATKFTGGIGPCGKEVCCKIFLSSFEPVSIRMAKKQELVLNPGKLSGVCGRLMCCLGFEIGQPAKKELPYKGKRDTVVTKAEHNKEAGSPPRSSPFQKHDTKKPAKEKALKAGQLNVPVKTGPEKEITTEKPKEKDRGKPFNKRKKFWKKKKH